MAARQPTNEELIQHLQTAGRGTPEATTIMEELWAKNMGLVRQIVHKTTGLHQQEPGFEDMEQQAYFGFHAAAFFYSLDAGVKFSTYAAKRIEWELYRYYEQNGFTVRIPAFMRRRLKECMKMQRRLEAETGRHVTKEAVLKAMGLSPTAIASTLVAVHKLQTVSLDAPYQEDTDVNGTTLLNIMTDGSSMEEIVIGQEWQRELHTILLEALQDIQEDIRGIIYRHYFSGVSIVRMAQEYGITKQAIYIREKKAFQSIRAGRYGTKLAEFMPSMSKKEQANRQIRRDQIAIARLQLSETEKEFLAL